MRIVPTSMHDARRSRTIRNLVFFVDRKGVDICANGNYRRFGVGRFDDIRDDTASSRRNSMMNTGSCKPSTQIVCGGEFLAAQFGVPVEMASYLRELRGNLPELRLDSPEDRISLLVRLI
jgi:hypothetical protein